MSRSQKNNKGLVYQKQDVPKFLQQFSHLLGSSNNNNYLNEEVGYQSNDEEDLEILRKEKDNNTNDICNRLFSEIVSRQFMFNRKSILINAIKNVSIESLLDFCEKNILNNTNKCIIQINGN